MSFPLEDFINLAIKQGKSDEYIESCIKYIKILESNSYPVLFSLDHLAFEIGIDKLVFKSLIGELNNGLNLENKYYRYSYFKLRKRNGGHREIMAPAKDLKYFQKWILVNILEKYPLRDSCKGFRSGISIFQNAQVHENADVILKVDLLKFYDTITDKRVYGVFKNMGYIENLAVSLSKLTTAKHRIEYWNSFEDGAKSVFHEYINGDYAILPQGAPSSPMLANIIASKMDRRFEELSKILNFNYSRYADDLAFSIKFGGRLPSISQIKKIIDQEGFFVNDKKTKYMRRGTKQYVTGLTTTNGVNVSKSYRNEIAQHIYYCRVYGVKNHLEKIAKDFPNYNNLQFHDWLYGHICFIKSINETASGKLLKDFMKINWSL